MDAKGLNIIMLRNDYHRSVEERLTLVFESTTIDRIQRPVHLSLVNERVE